MSDEQPSPAVRRAMKVFHDALAVNKGERHPDATGDDLIWKLRNIAEEAGEGSSRDLAMGCVREIKSLRRQRDGARRELESLADELTAARAKLAKAQEDRDWFQFKAAGKPRTELAAFTADEIHHEWINRKIDEAKAETVESYRLVCDKCGHEVPGASWGSHPGIETTMHGNERIPLCPECGEPAAFSIFTPTT